MKTKLYIIDGPWPGRLAILPRPRGGDWLEDEIAGWKEAGLEVIVSALTPEEIESMDLDEEQAAAQRHGLEFLSCPIADRGTPPSFTASTKLFRKLGQLLNEGKHIGIHCRQAIGRSSLIAASLLILAGLSAKAAWERVESARGCSVPDTAEQKAWVERFTRAELAETPPA
jgi:protein-tyrosine phosphatase